MTTAIPVLIVDDEESMLDSLGMFLEDEGYEVHLATDGEKALEAFGTVEPRAVVTDLRMPRLSGIDLIRHIRSKDPYVPVLIMTAYGSLEGAVAAIRLNVSDFIEKPIDLDYLKGALHRACNKMRDTSRIRFEDSQLREQLALVQGHLERYEERMSDLRSLALAIRILAEVVRRADSRLAHLPYRPEILEIAQLGVEDLKAMKEKALYLEQTIRSILRRVGDCAGFPDDYLEGGND
ncbi:response regulator [Desulfoferrobacter suflitae]|uniref:response regulator n=1 Tax=Desulfoferrobacter suflitae TaxID=2865782 RepID=UPI002164D39A|nr:response regulator [Desulfoferrobacter suflitae]MCK8600147.1 response regulator [Desulfoferrobacter suflitae]